MTTPRTLDTPEAACAFNSHGCSKLSSGHGGFDQHHRWPKSLGGPENPDDLLVLCALHHSRQHALVRYLVENEKPARSVTGHYTAAELLIAQYAVDKWRASGSVPVAGWSRPAAR